MHETHQKEVEQGSAENDEDKSRSTPAVEENTCDQQHTVSPHAAFKEKIKQQRERQKQRQKYTAAEDHEAIKDTIRR
ncbi:MAG: hypothetical protein Fur0041_06620 [Bacteroidia bacterium]